MNRWMEIDVTLCLLSAGGTPHGYDSIAAYGPTAATTKTTRYSRDGAAAALAARSPENNPT